LSILSGVPLVLDYRDAWLQNHFMDDMFRWQKRIMRNQELQCLLEAEAVIGLDDFMVQEIAKEYKQITVNYKVIPHGFDPQDFSNLVKPTIRYEPEKLNFLYSGLFYESNQPDIFLKAIKQAINQEQVSKDEIHLHFQGGLDKRIRKLVQELKLGDIVTDHGYQPHKTAVANIKKADVLWMISNFDRSHKQVKSGKLFEYFGAAKPILGLMHNGEEARLLQEYGAGYVGSLNSEEQLSQEIAGIYSQWKNSSLPEPNQEFIDQFNRKKLTQKLAKLFDKISSQ
jgi:glycosyltransferase involved in cell wall biosynthesis